MRIINEITAYLTNGNSYGLDVKYSDAFLNILTFLKHAFLLTHKSVFNTNEWRTKSFANIKARSLYCLILLTYSDEN